MSDQTNIFGFHVLDGATENAKNNLKTALLRGNAVLKENDRLNSTLSGSGLVGDDITGTDQDDVLEGSENGDIIQGGQGNDFLAGNGGNDILRGNRGDDEIRGGAGDDVILGGKGDDNLFGGSGSDVFVFRTGDGNDHVRGFNATNDDEKIDLTAVESIKDFTDLRNNHMMQVGGDIVIDTGGGNSIRLHSVKIDDLDPEDFILSFNTVDGSEAGDKLLGTDGRDFMRGLGGDDIIEGRGGDDILVGGDGADTFGFADGDGNDEIRGFDATEDQLNLTGVSTVSSFQDLFINRMSQVGNDVVIDTGDGNSITLRSVNMSDLREDNFVMPEASPTAVAGEDEGLQNPGNIPDSLPVAFATRAVSSGEAATATPKTFVGEFKVGDNTVAVRNVLLPDGNILVARTVKSGDGYRIDGQVFDQNGVEVSEVFAFPETASRDTEYFVNSRDFSLLATADGRIHLSFEPNPASVKNHSLFPNISYDATARWVSYEFEGSYEPIYVTEHLDWENRHYDDNYAPVMTHSEDGEVVRAFVTEDGYGEQATGIVLPGQIGIDRSNLKKFNGNSDAEVRLTTLENGTYVLVLDRDGKFGNDDHLYFEVIAKNGDRVRQANIHHSGDKVFDPAVAALTGGGFVIAWAQDDGRDTDVFFQIFDEDGRPLTSIEGGPNGVGGNLDNNNEPAIVALEDGSFIIFIDKDMGTRGVWGRRYDGEGNAISDLFHLTDDNATGIDATLLDEGRIAVTWQVYGENKAKLEILSTSGTEGKDDLTGSDSDEVLHGFGDDDLIYGGGGDDDLFGDDGDDTITGGRGDDRLHGGAGSDVFVFGTGDGQDVVTDFDAHDDSEKIQLRRAFDIEDFQDLVQNHMRQVGNHVVIEFGNGDTVKLKNTNLEDLDEADFLLQSNWISGTDSSDSLTGTAGDDEIRGGDGADSITGRGGRDDLYGGSGADVFNFNDYSDVDVVWDFDLSEDRINLAFVDAIKDWTDFRSNHASQQGGDVLINGGGGNELWLVGVSLEELSQSNFVFAYDTVNGTLGNDVLLGTEGADVVRGYAGNDLILAGKGNDIINGGSGDDVFVFRRGDGDDEILNFKARNDGEKIDLSDLDWLTDFDTLKTFYMRQIGTDVVLDFGGFDSITLKDVDLNDLDEADFIFEADIREGTDDSEILIGTDAGQKIHGGGGNDVIMGRGGTDHLYGGEGADSFLFNDTSDVDIIWDFDVSEDKISLSQLDGITDWTDLFQNHLTEKNGHIQINDNDGNELWLVGVKADALSRENFSFALNDVNGTNSGEILYGTDDDDMVRGYGGDDLIVAGRGDDVINGGSGSDTFIFRDGDGNDRLINFDLSGGERIDLFNVSDIENFEDLMADHVTQTSKGAVIHTGEGDSILLEGVTVDSLNESHFIF